MSRNNIELKCGKPARYYVYQSSRPSIGLNVNKEIIEVSLGTLHYGSRDKDFSQTMAILTELTELGYENDGLSFVTGWYDEIEDIILQVSRSYDPSLKWNGVRRDK